MRLHHLEITAFGPFADTVTVDFDELGADGLFLLHGRTGAGKTTVLDAVAFALYGTVPGARREGKRLLSDHAPAGAVPRVTLEATIGGRRLRIVRSPEYGRPKRRGAGMITENAKATLTWLDGVGENLSRIPDIAEEVGRLLGMSADQFFQVVLLPQGEFATFLRAENDERGTLLERLFDTTRFGSVEEWFLDRRRSSEKQLEAQLSSVEVLLGRIGTAAGIESATDAEPMLWARKLLEEARETRERTDGELTRVRAEDAAARAALTEAHRVRDLQARRRRAEETRAEHESGADHRAALAVELDAARRAAPVAAIGEDTRRGELAAERAMADVRQLADRLGSSPDGARLVGALSWPPTAADRDTIRSRQREWSDEVVRLDGLIEQSSVADRLDADLEGHRAEQNSLERTVTELAEARRNWPAALRVAEDELRAAETARAGIPALEAARERAADAASAAVELHTQRAERDAGMRSVADARQRHHDAREHLLDLREWRIAGMAAELAADLVDGQPCTVCGSPTHPWPARASESTVTRADEDAARAAEQGAGASLRAAEARLAEVEKVIGVLVQRGGDGDRDGLAAALGEATAALDAAIALSAQVPQRTAVVEQLRERGNELQERFATAERELAVLGQQIEAEAAQLADLRTRIAQAVGGDGTVQARRERLDALAAAAADLLDARDRAATLDAAARELAAKAETAAVDAGFDSVEYALGAVRSANRLQEIEHALASARDQRVSAEAVLAEPEILEITDREPVELSGLEQASRESAAAVDAAVAAAAEADRRLADLERLIDQLETALERLAPMRSAHDELSGLADVVAGRGQNARKMSLRSYVLAARLEEVAVAASARLRRMSGGRYEFVHSDAAGSRGKRGGLGLDIHDDYTGAVRPAKTLSGGESFQASLALALGLADVVAAESGGLVLDTIFIDEGFGTLDADALDSVMGVLDELRAGGRVVGIVSHVDEMRQRIPSRLHVVRGRTGSTVEVIAG